MASDEYEGGCYKCVTSSFILIRSTVPIRCSRTAGFAIAAPCWLLPGPAVTWLPVSNNIVNTAPCKISRIYRRICPVCTLQYVSHRQRCTCTIYYTSCGKMQAPSHQCAPGRSAPPQTVCSSGPPAGLWGRATLCWRTRARLPVSHVICTGWVSYWGVGVYLRDPNYLRDPKLGRRELRPPLLWPAFCRRSSARGWMDGWTDGWMDG